MKQDTADTRTRAAQAFQRWLDLFRRSAAGDDEAFLAQQAQELRNELRQMIADYHGLRGSMGDSAPALQPGRVVADYRLVRELGRGGMGVVWEAEQLALGRRVALKLLLPHCSLSPGALAKFEREARAGGRLSHPGIVQTYAVGATDGMHWIAQELVPGGYTLADALSDLREQHELPDDYYRKTAELVAKVADALEHAHRHGVIHRDVKPSNILITEQDEPRVADFGLARIQDELGLSRTGALEGTPYYMSPEQAAAKSMGIDHRTDVFSLGSTLYEALALVRAFDGDTTQHVFQKILTVDPLDPRAIRSKVPKDLAVICLKALEKNPDRRYPGMEAMAADLRRWLDGHPIEARPLGPLGHGLRWARRRPAAAIAACAALLLATVTGGLGTYSLAARDRADSESRARVLEQELRLRSEQERDLLAQQARDRELLERMLDLASSFVLNGTELDRAATLERTLGSLLEYGFALDGSMALEESAAPFRAAAARNPELGQVLLDALYGLAVQLDAEHLKRSASAANVDPVARGALRERVQALLPVLDTDPARLELWGKLKELTLRRNPSVDEIFDEKRLRSLSAQDLTWLLYLTTDIEGLSVQVVQRAGALRQQLLGVIALEVGPIAPMLLYQQYGALAALDLWAKEYDEALHHLEVMYVLRPRSPLAPLLMSQVHAARGDREKMERSIQRAIALDPSVEALAWSGVGGVYAGAGRLKEAIETLQRAAELQPNSPGVHYSLSTCWKLSGEPQKALEEATRACELDPTSRRNISAHGDALYWTQQYEASLATFSKLVEIDPDDADGHRLVGDALAALQRTREAVGAYCKAVALDAKSYAAQSLPALVLREIEKMNASTSALDAEGLIAELRGGLPDSSAALHLALSKIEKGRGHPNSALKEATRAHDLDPSSSDCITTYGDALYWVGHYDASLAAFSKLVEMDPRNAEGQRLVGDALAALQRPSEAIAAYCKAIELDPRSPATYLMRSAATRRLIQLRASGKPEEVLDFVQEQRRILSAAPPLEEFNRRLDEEAGQALLAAGRLAEAQRMAESRLKEAVTANGRPSLAAATWLELLADVHEAQAEPGLRDECLQRRRSILSDLDRAEPVNLDFESGDPGAAPSGWFLSTPQGYAAVLTEEHPRQGLRCALLTAPEHPSSFGNLLQAFDARDWRGHRFHFRASVKVDGDKSTQAQLWLRVDRPGLREIGYFDNMDSRPIRSSVWAEYEIKGKIDADAQWINFGLILKGTGRAWLDAASFELLD